VSYAELYQFFDRSSGQKPEGLLFARFFPGDPIILSGLSFSCSSHP
jgi:hypothetical protein